MANTEWAFPFADNNGDRVYSDADFAKFFSAWFVNGVFINVGSGLQLLDSVAGGMRITLKSGAANINGRVYYLNTDTDFTVPVASPVQDRTDSVTVKLDLTNRTMNVIYKQGDTSVTRNNSVYELQLATIFVAKNISEITQSMITDMRTSKNVCGLASPNDPIDVDSFITQFKALFDKQLTDNNNAFTSWFDNLKNELDSNQATNLQNQITKNQNNITNLQNDVPNYVRKTDIGNVKVWQPNTNYNVNDIVYLTHINSNDMTLGQIDGGLMRCLVKHTSDSTLFPSSDSGYWELINAEAYKMTGTLSYGYGRTLVIQRIGNVLKMGYYATSGTQIKYGAGTTNLAEKLPDWANPDINGNDMVLYINSTDWPGTRIDWVLAIHNNANTSSFSSFGDISSGAILRGNGTTLTNAKPYWAAAQPTS